jgi:hypothetical protein
MSSSSSLMKAWNCSIFLYAFINIMAFVRSVDSHCISRLARRDEAEQTSQKFQDPEGSRMKIWRPSLPDDTNKIPICPRKLAQSLRISPTTICHYLSDALGLKCFQLHSVPHTLTVDQKAKYTQYAETMLQIFTVHESPRFHFLYTGDKSWLFYSYHKQTRWVASWDDARLLNARPTITKRQYYLCSSMK